MQITYMHMAISRKMSDSVTAMNNYELKHRDNTAVNKSNH